MKWFFGILCLLLFAVVLDSGLLAYAAYVLMSLLVLSRFLARNWIGNLTAIRKKGDLAAEIGATIEIRITLRNTGWLPVPWVLLEDFLPGRSLQVGHPRLKVKGKRVQLKMLWGGARSGLQYRLQALMRGYYQIGPLLLESGDLFGLHRRYRIETEPQFLLVYPRVVPLEGYELASRRPIGDIRLTYQLFEDPTRIAGVREYQAGDPMNRVHWRASARTGALHCKVYEPSTIAGATLMLDFHQAGYHARGEPFRSELAVTTAASLANAVYLMGHPVGLVTNGRDAVDRIRQEDWEGDYRTRTAARRDSAVAEESDRLEPLVVETRRGVEQFERIRETLARVEMTNGLSFAQLVVETTPRLARDATLVALLPDVPVETALALGNLRRHGFAVTAVLMIMEDSHLEKSFGRLVAEGIRDVRHLKSEEEVPFLCRQQVERSAPLDFAAET